jgi:hypothetical protein
MQLHGGYSKYLTAIFVSFSTKKTSLIVSYEENGAEHFAIVPLLTITAAMAPA